MLESATITKALITLSVTTRKNKARRRRYGMAIFRYGYRTGTKKEKKARTKTEIKRENKPPKNDRVSAFTALPFSTSLWPGNTVRAVPSVGAPKSIEGKKLENT